mmetsp:Transcript_3016/g.4357  ORF Transcript_3016/g.4357 Transcript_3016/m.4357 type:complete len:212 (-) Transcript_3016:356-991(-)
MIAQFRLIRVERGNKQRSARISHTNTLTLNIDETIGNNTQQDIGRLLIQKIDIIHVQDTTMRLGKQTRTEHRLTRLDTLLQISRTNESILHHIERNLYKGGLDDLRLAFFQWYAATLEVRSQKVIHTLETLRIDVEWGSFDHLNGGQQAVYGTRHNTLCGTLTSADHDSAHAVVDGGKEQSLFDGVLSDNHTEWEWSSTGLHQCGSFDADL